MDYYAAENKLSERGFLRNPSEDVICRWRHGESGVLFDLMPMDEAILGAGIRRPYAAPKGSSYGPICAFA